MLIPLMAGAACSFARPKSSSFVPLRVSMLVLRSLQLEPMHGWGITERIEQWSEHVLQLGQGTLYPALYRLEQQDFIRSEWRITDNNRRARYYSLTAKGRRYLNESLAQWRRMSRAINLVLDATT